LKPFIQSSTKGFTLLELIIASVVALIVLSITLSLVVGQRRQLSGNQRKIDFNQNLRAANDFIGTDIKQVGERVENDSQLPVVRLIPGASASAPDMLVLQRKLITDYLSLCTAMPSKTVTTLTIAQNLTSGTNCNYSDGTTPPDSLTDSLNAFKEYRCSLSASKTVCTRGNNDATSAAIASAAACDSECVYAYIYDPSDGVGEFFLYTDETYETLTGGGAGLYNRIHAIPLNASGQWQKKYSTNARIYILEEKKYALCEGIFQQTINRSPAYNADCPYPTTDPKPLRLVEGINNMQVRVLTASGWQSSFNNDLSAITDWKQIKKIEVDFETRPSQQLTTESKTLTLKSEFFPRNVLSIN
jgi:prepilin-type N-terminal cleavage/methylation domain-containing protein